MSKPTITEAALAVVAVSAAGKAFGNRSAGLGDKIDAAFDTALDLLVDAMKPAEHTRTPAPVFRGAQRPAMRNTP